MGLYNHNFNCASLFLLKKSSVSICFLKFSWLCNRVHHASSLFGDPAAAKTCNWVQNETHQKLEPIQEPDYPDFRLSDLGGFTTPTVRLLLAACLVAFGNTVRWILNIFELLPQRLHALAEKKLPSSEKSFAVKQMKQKHGTLCAPCGHYVARISLGVEPNRWHTTSTSQLIQMFFSHPHLGCEVNVQCTSQGTLHRWLSNRGRTWTSLWSSESSLSAVRPQLNASFGGQEISKRIQ